MSSAVDQSGALCERDDALRDVQAHLAEYGAAVTIKLRGEADITRDRLNSIARRKTVAPVFAVNAYPIEMTPTRHRLERAGLKDEQTSVIVWTAMQDWTDTGNGFADIDIKRSSVTLNGVNYLVAQKALVSQFVDTFLYITLGLTKE